MSAKGSPPVAPPATGVLSEIFASVQGEGAWVGVRQVFVRFEGCDLACAYCDTPPNAKPVRCRVERTPGSGDFTLLENPLAKARVLDEIAALVARAGPVHSVSFTGGEPLLQTRMLRALLDGVRRLGVRTWLETHGGLPERLAEVKDLIDFVSMDIKLPWGGRDGTTPDVARRFLETARGCAVQAKVVVVRGLAACEVEEAARVVAAFDRRTPFILQPVTPFGEVGESDRPSPAELLALQAAALRHLDDVRVVPQLHKAMGAL